MGRRLWSLAGRAGSVQADLEAERSALCAAAAIRGYNTRGVATEPLVIASQRVVEIGMGGGPFSVAAIVAGASAYLGVDPNVGTDHVRDFRSLTDKQFPPYAPFFYSCADIMRLYPNIKLLSARLEDVVDEVRAFRADVAVLWGVTEHLHDPHSVIRTVWETLRRNGVIWLTHNNWYSWIGHHADPRTLKLWDRDDPAQNAVVDWRHLDPRHPLNADPNLNRMRMQDFRDLIETYFDVIEFSYEIHALPRLTPEIRNRYKHISLEEMLATSVRLYGKRRDTPRNTDLSTREFYHPSPNYMTDKDFSDEDIEPFRRVGYVHFGPQGQLVSHSDNDHAGRRAFSLLRPGQPIGLRKGNVWLKLTVSQLEHRASGEVRVIVREKVREDFLTVNRGMWVLESGGSAGRRFASGRRSLPSQRSTPAFSIGALGGLLRRGAPPVT